MSYFSKRFAPDLQRLSWLATGVALVAGCQLPLANGASDAPAKAAGSAHLPAAQQLMIKFKNAGRSCSASDIAALASETGQTLTFIRPMSGNACVVSHTAGDKALLFKGLQRLTSHPAVDWAEIDAIVRHY